MRTLDTHFLAHTGLVVAQGGADAFIGMIGLGVTTPGQMALLTGAWCDMWREAKTQLCAAVNTVRLRSRTCASSHTTPLDVSHHICLL